MMASTKSSTRALVGSLISIGFIFAAMANARCDDLQNVIVGYQGWFECPQQSGRWGHWFDHGQPTVEMLPDVSEYPVASKCPTPYRDGSGHQISVYDSASDGVVLLHLTWMRQSGIKVIALQRFASQLSNHLSIGHMDRVLAELRSAALKTDRRFYIEYDLSGLTDDRLKDVLSDWSRLAVTYGANQAYARERQRPIVELWGLGFKGRKLTPQAVLSLVTSLKTEGLYVIGGVPSSWRVSTGDADSNPAWTNVYRELDAISPWVVGRFNDIEAVENWYRGTVEDDVKLATEHGQNYLPVVFSGFSWSNLQASYGKQAPRDAIPRKCGEFFQAQLAAAAKLHSKGIFVAMFDEVDEGTAIYKVLSSGEEPVAQAFLGSDDRACHHDEDYFMQTAGHYHPD